MSIAFRLALSPDLDQQERATLLEHLAEVGTVHDDQARHFGPDLDWSSIVFIAHDLRDVAGAIVSVSALAREVLRWRDKLRRDAVEPAVVLSRPGAEPIDLRTADDEAVEAWVAAADEQSPGTSTTP
jgi:hypothetical protein